MSWNCLWKSVSGGIVGFLMLSACAPDPVPIEQEAVAFWMNGQPVMLDAFQEEVEVKIKTWDIETSVTDEEYARILDISVHDLVQQSILRKKAAELGIDIEIPEMAESAEFETEYPEGFQMLADAEDQWRSRLQRQMESMSLAAQISEQMSLDVSVEDDVLEDVYQDNLSRFTDPEELELQVIRVYDPDLAEDIHNKLKRGWKFRRLAENYSNLRGDGAGGNIIRKGIGEFPTIFESILRELKPGRISDVLTSEEGYFIYRLEKRFPSKILPFEEVKDRLKQEYYTREKTRIFQEWLDAEIANTVIKMGTPLPYPGELQ